MNILELLNINTESQKGYKKFKEYLTINRAIHCFVYCINNQLDEIDTLSNQSEFKLSRMITTLIFLKDCVEQQDVAELKSIQKLCDDILFISNFRKFIQLVNYILKTEVYYIDEKLTSSIESSLIEHIKATEVGAHYDSEKNEFIFDDIECNISDTQHLFDKLSDTYSCYKQYNFS